MADNCGKIPPNPYNEHAWITGEPVIGPGTWIGAFTLIDGRGGLTIGRGCDISSGAQIVTHSTVRRCGSERRYDQVDSMPTAVEDHVFIGSNAVVLMGCRIGHHSVIGAGAVVPEATIVPPYSLVVGVPGHVVRDLRAEIEQWAREGPQPASDVREATAPAGEAERADGRRLVSVVTPVFNEEENLRQFVCRTNDVRQALAERGCRLEIVLVDDHSSDRTPAIARQLLAEYPGIRYLRLSRNCGSHTALAAGLQACSGQAAVLMAADLQDPPELIPQLVEHWQQGHDVVWAGRASREGESRQKKFFAAAYYWLMRRLALPEMPKQGADVVLLDRKVIDAYNAIPEKHTSLLAMILWMGFRQTSISYAKRARQAGKSKWTLAKKVKLLVDSIVSFSYVPIRVMTVLGFGMALLGFLYAIVVVLGRLFGWVVAGTGFAALMTVLLVGQGLILSMLGVLGEYLWRTFDEARGRPRYLIEEELGSGDPKPLATRREQ